MKSIGDGPRLLPAAIEDARLSAPVSEAAPRAAALIPDLAPSSAPTTAGSSGASWWGGVMHGAGRAAQAVTLAALFGIAGCATNPAITSAQFGLHTPAATAVLDEAFEARTLGGPNQPGRLVELQAGLPGAPRTLTVHGINTSPDGVRVLTDAARSGGGAVATFAWDDRHRRLTDSSHDLARALETWMAADPGAPLRIEAHSMGARITLGALAELHAAGKLTTPVELILVAPHLQGVEAANGAAAAPGFIGALIGGVRPGVDMGTRSAFQAQLESIALPSTVKTTIYVGDRDHLVDYADARFTRVASRLDARTVYVRDAGHDGVLEVVAQPAGARDAARLSDSMILRRPERGR